MKEILDHSWVKVLVIATTIAMCSFALRETASITQPVFSALADVLVPVAVAFAIAYVVMPIVDLLHRWGLPRAVASGLLFGLGSLLLIAAVVLVVPPVVNQAVDMSVRVFQGESFEDRNGNGRWDPGEPFDDRDRNGGRDPAMLSRGLAWMEGSQARLRVKLKLGLNEPALGFLACYAEDTEPLRSYLHTLLLAARGGEAREHWPVPPPGLAVAKDAIWSPAWPGLRRDDVAEAAELVPAADRTAWIQAVLAAGAELHRIHSALLAAARQDRSGTTLTDPVGLRVHAARSGTLTDEARTRAMAMALELESAAEANQAAAREALTAAGASLGGKGEVGSSAFTAVVGRIEESVRTTMADLPGRVATWASSGMGGFDAIASWLLAFLLVPIYAFFLVLAMPTIRRGIKSYLPGHHHDQVVRIVRDIERVVSAFFRGRLIICLACAVTGVLGFLGISLLGVHVPYGILFGVAIGLATAIPLAGLAFLIPALALTMLEPGSTGLHLLAVVGVYLLVQGLEAVLIPAIMGREVELHPVTLIVALLLCGKLLGVLGLILAVPIAASARILLREYFWPRLGNWAVTGSWSMPPQSTLDESGPRNAT